MAQGDPERGVEGADARADDGGGRGAGRGRRGEGGRAAVEGAQRVQYGLGVAVGEVPGGRVEGATALGRVDQGVEAVRVGGVEGVAEGLFHGVGEGGGDHEAFASRWSSSETKVPGGPSRSRSVSSSRTSVSAAVTGSPRSVRALTRQPRSQVVSAAVVVVPCSQRCRA